MKAAYKDCISIAHISAYRKTLHNVRCSNAAFNAIRREPNSKRRACVQKRLNKLTKYVRRAWKRYSYGKLKARA